MEASIDTWLTDIVVGTMNAADRVIIGMDMDTIAQNDPDDVTAALVAHGGFIPIASQLAYSFTSNPGHVSLAQYKNYLLAQAQAPLFSIAHAQTYGADILSPMVNIWRGARNIAYILVAAVSAVAGLMIMFRKKIDPRTSVTVMYMLPRMVITLILITFSYPIAAFIIELSFVATGLVVSIFTSPTILGMSGGESFSIAESIASVAISLVVGGTAFSLMYLLLFTIAVGMLAFTIFSVLIQLLVRYARLLLMTALGPILIVWDLLPGDNKQANSWIRGIIANALAFPGIIAMLILALRLAMVPSLDAHSNPLSLAGITGNILSNYIMPITAIIVLWQAHKIPKAIDKAILGKDRLPAWYAPGFKQKR